MILRAIGVATTVTAVETKCASGALVTRGSAPGSKEICSGGEDALFTGLRV